MAGHDVVDGAVEGGRVGHVEDGGLTVDLLGHRVGGVVVEVVDHDLGAVGGEPTGKGRAQTRTSTGDEGDATFSPPCMVADGRRARPAMEADVGSIRRVATASAATTNRVLTIPNVITVVGWCCIPVFLWLLFGADEPATPPAVLLGALGRHRLGRRLRRPPLQPGVRAGQGARPDRRPAAVHRVRRRHHHRRSRAALVLPPGRGARGRWSGGTVVILTLFGA